MEDLANLTCLYNVNSDKNKKIMVFETCQGLIIGTLLRKQGGQGTIIQVYHGDFPNRTCIDYMQLPQSHFNSIFSVNFQNILKMGMKLQYSIDKPINENSDFCDNNGIAIIKKKDDHNTVCDSNGKKYLDDDDLSLPKRDNVKLLKHIEIVTKRKYEEEKAIEIIFPQGGDFNDFRSMDSLIIASKFHPKHIALSLMRFLKYSRPIAIYSQYREPLLDCYQALKKTDCFIDLQISETWLREHQVLPDRTHPVINMDGRYGYILSGIHVNPTME
ncbi:unnamed protein product [Gordionus sp. m RMFG-2023]|uniref:tRNA (adenine(58)-N(1))-methyltransferase non-catalytic subunit TRM6-like isoform X2 n=1 Tax=Gordionus sp. m RMFG-2023 TaxID=3053472 RepID=UPI0030E0275F